MLILIVDSSIQILKRLEEIISETGNLTSIHKAVSYEEATVLIKKNRYDAVLLDIDLPGNKSLKLVREIKKAAGETRIIMQYTYLDNYLQQQYKSLGVDFFFDKYYEFEKICGLLGLSH